MDRFAQILYDLGKEIGLDLYPDANRICQLNYQEQLHMQILYNEAKEHLLFVTFVCEVPPGKYRETLFREALKHNGIFPRMGTFAYTGRNNQLTLFEYFPTSEHSAEKWFSNLQAFIEKAHTWKDAVENGKPLPSIPGQPGTGESIFGLKP